MSTSRYPYQPSQSGSLVSEVTGLFTPEVIRSASFTVGESEPSTKEALHAAAPTVLSGMANMASSSEGMSGLSAMIREGGYGGLTENPASVFRGGSATNYMVSAGQRHLGKIFGGDLSSVVERIARSTGINASSANKLLALTTPLTLGVLGKRSSAQKAGSPGLTELLLRQKDEIAAAVPSVASRAPATGPRVVSGEREVATASPTHIEHFAESAPITRARRPSGGMRWLPFALLLIAAIALLGYLLSRVRTPRVTGIATQGMTTARNALARITLPGGVNLSVPPGSINYNLAHFLGDRSATDLPRTFVFDHLNFQSATTQLTPDSEKTVSDLAQVLRAYPAAQIQLVGHTDNTGNPQNNQALSLNRANAIKAILVNNGISSDRISTQGFGQNRPVASNDTEEGRARNRRIELNVIHK